MMGSIVAATSLHSVVLDVDRSNTASIRLAEARGAQRREPPRVERDRSGVPRTMIVFVLAASDQSELRSGGRSSGGF